MLSDSKLRAQPRRFKCLIVSMQNDLDQALLDRVEPLVTELKAIEWWDVEYMRNIGSVEHEKFAFEARQMRRSEILSKLLGLIRQLDK